MIGREIEVERAEDLVRLVRTLGQHRYVAGRLHLAHAFALEGIDDPWAKDVLGDAAIDLGSKDERLVRNVTDAELVQVLGAFWGEDDGPRERLVARLESIGVDASDGEPFDESREDEMFPVLVDAGWELLPLTKLDAERHRGAMEAFGTQLEWEVAKFEEENTLPPVPTLHELPLLGAAELLFPHEGTFVLWMQGSETYLDYVLRGILRAAKIDQGAT